MILYHGSDMKVHKPNLQHSRPNVDFGRGFYTTPILEQAVKWCGKFKRRGKKGILSKYMFNEAAYDIVIGGVANDKVFNTVELYFDRLIDKGEAIKRLCYEKTNLQICFRSQAVIDNYLHFEGSESV